jgi:ribosomal protein S18 acetylase RimI-like enzyme
MYALFDFAKGIAIKELWVYTGSSDDIAISFYKRIGFEVLGSAGNSARGRTMDDSDVVLKRILQ